MSFPKAKTKRFNEVSNCAPPPGHYNPKGQEKVSNVIIDKTGRFKENKENTPGPGGLGLDTFPNLSICSATPATPKKTLLFKSGAIKLKNGKPPRPGANSAEATRIKELEKEVRRLAMERTDLDKRLQSKDSEVVRLDGRLHQAQKDRCSLLTKAASLERQMLDLEKANSCLKTKVAAHKNGAERDQRLSAEITSLKEQLSKKSVEVKDVQKQMDSAKETSHAEMANLRTSIRELNKDKEALEQSKLEHDAASTELSQKLKSLEEELERNKSERQRVETRLTEAREESDNIRAKLEATCHEANARVEEVRGQLDVESTEARQRHEAMLRQMQDNLADSEGCYQALATYKDALVGEVAGLKETVRIMKMQKLDHEDHIRHLKGELFAVTDQLWQSQESLEQAQKDIATLNGLITHLQASEDTLNNNVRALTDKYQFLETNMVAMENDAYQKECRLEQELAASRYSHLEVQEECERLSSMNSRLMEAFNAEKVEREEAEEALTQLEETVLSMRNDLSAIETEKQHARQAEEAKAEAIRSLDGEKQEMQSRLLQLELALADERAEKEASLEELSGDAEAAMEQVDQLEEALAEGVAEREEMEAELLAQLAVARGEATEFAAQMSVSREEASQLRSELQQAQANVEQLQGHVADSEEKLCAQVSQQQEQLAAVEQQRGKLQCQMEQLEADLAVANSELSEQQTRVISLEASLAAADAERKETVEQQGCVVDQLQKDYQVAQEQTEQLQQQVKNLEGVLAEKESMLGEMRADLVAEQDRSTQLEVSLRDHVQEVAALSQTLEQEKAQSASILSDLEQRLGQEKAQSASTLSDLEQEKAQSASILSDLEQKLEHEKAQSASILSDLEQRLEQEKAQSASLLSDLEQRLEQEKAQSVEHGSETSQLHATVQEQAGEISRLEAELGHLSSQLTEHQQRLSEVQTKLEDSEIRLAMREEELGRRLSAAKEEAKQLSVQLLESRDTLSSKEEQSAEQLRTLQEDHEQHVAHLTVKNAGKMAELQEQVNVLQLNIEGLVSGCQQKLEEQRREYDERLVELAHDLRAGSREEELHDMETEMKKWKQMYEDLWHKVKPFQEQLDAFAAERQALLSQSVSAQTEVQKLSREYAKLLGHQNQKQKIQHVLKLKEENNDLRQTIAKLHEEVCKQKRKISRMDDDMRKLDPGRRKFDPSKAFSHEKENAYPASPLREGNRC